MSKRVPHHQVTLSLTLSLGIGLSVLATALVSRWEVSSRQIRFQRQIENLATALQRSLNRYTDLLAFLGDYYAVEPSSVNRQAFAGFVQRSLQTHSGIQALEWAPFIQHTSRLAYEQRVQAEGFSGFTITELGGDGSLVPAALRPSYVPVTYIEPFQGNESALGYDLYSDFTRAVAIAQARDRGAITATGRIRLVQEKRDQFSFLVFQPTYQSDPPPEAIDLRRQQFTGVLLGVFRVSDVVEESLQSLQYEINFAIYDRSAAPHEQFLGWYDAVRKQVLTVKTQSPSQRQQSVLCPSLAACTKRLIVGQRQWAIVVSPSARYAAEPQYGAIATLMIGLLLTSGLVLFLQHLNRELEQAQSLSILKSRFFSMASHELRTPLSTILLSSESLQTHYHQLTEAQKQTNIQRIYLTARRMSQQLTDLLTLTRAEVGKLELHPEIIHLEQFCQHVIDEMQMGVRQPIQFKKIGQSSKGFLDKTLLRSLLTNLLSNAAKYSPADAPIQVTLHCTTHTAILQVRDHGIGIPPDDQPHIWQAFYRGSNVGEVVGTGLGLAIVKTCVNLHQGTWQIESAAEDGTTVTIELPLE